MSKPEHVYDEPLNKKQKRGDGDDKEAAPEIYDEATARKMLEEAVLVTAEEANGGEAVIGFDPELLDALYPVVVLSVFRRSTTPMIHFSEKGDAKMCRYLVSRGASTTKAEDSNFHFPMYLAARNGHLDVCKFLYENGAENDVRRATESYWTPFIAAACNSRDEVLRWLVLHGALCADNSSEDVCVERARIDHENEVRSCERLVEWAEEVIQSHSALITFLGGTLAPAHANADQRCILQSLSGHPGVRKHIADFVGLEVTKRKQLRILRNVKEVLSFYIKRWGSRMPCLG
jgi:hypothetical protein